MPFTVVIVSLGYWKLGCSPRFYMKIMIAGIYKYIIDGCCVSALLFFVFLT